MGHQVEGDLVEQGTDYEGKVVEVLRKGIIDVDGNVIRRCLIVGGKPTAEREAAMKKEEEAKAAEKLEDEEAEKLLEEEKEVETSVDEAEEDEDKDDSDTSGSCSK